MSINAQMLRITPEQAQEIRMRCLNWVKSMADKGYLKPPFTDAQIMDLAKQVEGWTFGGFAPVVTPPTPMHTIHEAMFATRQRADEILKNLPPEAIEKYKRIMEAISIWERFMADMTAAVNMPSH